MNTRVVKLFGRSVNLFAFHSGVRTDNGVFRNKLIDARLYSDQESDDGSEITKRKSSSKTTALGARHSEISSTLILFQDGLRIQELPVLVKRTYDISDWTDETDSKVKTIVVEPNSSANEQNEELNKVIQLHLRQVNSVTEVLQYLLVIPAKDLTPLVALSILERIIELQNDSTDEGQTRKTPLMENTAVMTLCNVICRSSNLGIILCGLQTIIKMRLQFSDAEKRKYIDIFVKECLERLHSSKLNLMHICLLVENLFNAGSSYRNVSDNVWSEIVAREAEISVENINRVFALLLYLKSSRKVVLSMLERQIHEVYSKLQQKQVIHMLHILCLLKLQSTHLMSIFSSWTRLNVHKLTESGLRDIVMLMNSIHYTSSTVEVAIEHFMKMKGDKCKDALLMTALAEKVRLFRWRNQVVLGCLSNFFVKNVKDLSPDTWTGLVQVFGYLNYEPPNEIFDVLEKTLIDKMPDLDPETVISILLSCVYIQKYPLNFVKKLFSPGFLDRLNFQAGNDEVHRQMVYNNLKLLDTALNLECPTYSGPYLHRNFRVKGFRRDARLTRMQNKIRNYMCQILGGHNLFGTSIILPKMPLNDLYIVDFMIHLDLLLQCSQVALSEYLAISWADFQNNFAAKSRGLKEFREDANRLDWRVRGRLCQSEDSPGSLQVHLCHLDLSLTKSLLPLLATTLQDDSAPKAVPTRIEVQELRITLKNDFPVEEECCPLTFYIPGCILDKSAKGLLQLIPLPDFSKTVGEASAVDSSDAFVQYTSNGSPSKSKIPTISCQSGSSVHTHLNGDTPSMKGYSIPKSKSDGELKSTAVALNQMQDEVTSLRHENEGLKKQLHFLRTIFAEDELKQRLADALDDVHRLEDEKFQLSKTLKLLQGELNKFDVGN